MKSFDNLVIWDRLLFTRDTEEGGAWLLFGLAGDEEEYSVPQFGYYEMNHQITFVV